MFYPHYGFTFLATLLIVIGALALLTNFGVVTAAVWNWWPILFVILGIYILVLKKKKKKIAAGRIFHKLASDDRIQEKFRKIIDTVDEIIDKKLDEWQEEATQEKPEQFQSEESQDENIGKK